MSKTFLWTKDMIVAFQAISQQFPYGASGPLLSSYITPARWSVAVAELINRGWVSVVTRPPPPLTDRKLIDMNGFNTEDSGLIDGDWIFPTGQPTSLSAVDPTDPAAGDPCYSMVATQAGYLYGLGVTVNTPPALGTQAGVTLWVNGAATPVAAQCLAGQQESFDTVNAYALAPGDRFAFKLRKDGGSGVSALTATWQYSALAALVLYFATQAGLNAFFQFSQL
jgi:hypothetical protein